MGEETRLPDHAPDGKGDGTSTPKFMGDFRLLKVLGMGGMATVYKAEQVSLNRAVALKVLHEHLNKNEGMVQRFMREAKAIGRINHPNIVSIHATGEVGGRYYNAQELVNNGYTLTDDLAEVRKQSVLPKGYFREVAKTIAQVADALEHAHQSGVIHRDVKPSNILLTEGRQPKLTDFGLAKVENVLALSRTGDFFGTPYYMSPEQAMSHRIDIDHRTDIYSLGVTLYEMLALKLPFEGTSSHEVLKKVVLGDPKDPSKVKPSVPRDLSIICLKAMEKDPNRRYAGMADFRDDLVRFLQAEVIMAKPAGFTTRLCKRIKRYPIVATAVGTAAVALLLLAGNMLWSFGQIIEERNKALAINRFLESMLLAPDPAKEGKDVKVRDLLEKAANGLASAFPDQPGIRASLSNTIGYTFQSLGLYQEAEALHRNALELYRWTLDEEDPLRIQTMNDLACALMNRGVYQEAEELLERVIEIWSRERGRDHTSTLTAMNNLAATFFKHGKAGDAEGIYKRILELRRSTQGEDREETLSTKNNLAVVFIHQGKLKEAEPLLSEVLKARQDLLTKDHPSTLHSMCNLADLWERQGRFSEAELLYLEALKIQRRMLGDLHGDTLTTMNNLAGVEMKLSKNDLAKALYQEAMTGRSQALGKRHPSTLQSMNNMAYFYKHQGDRFNAEDLWLDLLERMESSEEGRYPEKLIWMNNLADFYLEGRGLTKAEPICWRVYEISSHELGELHSYTLSALDRLANVLLGLRRFSLAEEVLEGGLDRVTSRLPKDHINRIMLHATYARCKMMQEHFQKAEIHALSWYEGMKALREEGHPETKDAVRFLVELYSRWDQPEKQSRFRALLAAEESSQEE